MASEMPKARKLAEIAMDFLHHDADPDTYQRHVESLTAKFSRHTRGPCDPSDLAVLATTHQRTVEALREAEKAIRNAYGAITSGQTEDKDAAGTLRAALAKIKGAT